MASLSPGKAAGGQGCYAMGNILMRPRPPDLFQGCTHQPVQFFCIPLEPLGLSTPTGEGQTPGLCTRAEDSQAAHSTPSPRREAEVLPLISMSSVLHGALPAWCSMHTWHLRLQMEIYAYTLPIHLPRRSFLCREANRAGFIVCPRDCALVIRVNILTFHINETENCEP